ncbi:MAG: DUF1284 domain-containing protein [Methanobacteriaceae archaeon]|nr:DUF1284 domain-containing protein [Methanobacteriaceae archaeon]
MNIKLRGHHLLCIQGFQGYGYDENFVKNITKIKSLIDKDNPKIKVLNSHDDICRSCPNLTKDKICKDEKNNKDIIKMDEEVINKLNLENNPLNSDKLLDQINNIFNSSKKYRKYL